MNKMPCKIKVFIGDEAGSETVEWVVVTAIIAALIVATYNSGAIYNAVHSAMTKVINWVTLAG